MQDWTGLLDDYQKHESFLNEPRNSENKARTDVDATPPSRANEVGDDPKLSIFPEEFPRYAFLVPVFADAELNGFTKTSYCKEH